MIVLLMCLTISDSLHSPNHTFQPFSSPTPAPPPPHWYPRVPCVSDIDCELNGKCTSNGCQCTSGWEGVSCQFLSLRPAPDVGAYGFNPNISSWGATVIKISDTYHMWVSEFWGGCGVSSWQHNSHIIHATSSTAEGPFKYEDTALNRFSHNPKIVLGNDNKSRFDIILFHIGTATPYPPKARCIHGVPFCDPNDCNSLCNCTNTSLPHEIWPIQTKPNTVHNASSPNGPWVPATHTGLGMCNNPAPARHPNGTVFIMCHNNGLVLYRAPSYRGTYQEVGNMITRFVGMNASTGEYVPKVVWEDPFLWIDPITKYFHVICHAYPMYTHDYNLIVGGHGFSRNGLNWTWSSLPPYTSFVKHRNGTTLNYGTRERPSLLFEGGKPVALYTSVTLEGRPKQQVGVDASFTLMQPIG